MTRLANMFLRGLTLAARFLLIFFLARYLEPAEVGVYGLFTATIGYAFYFLGFDFYAYSTRELLGRDRSEWGWMLKSQGALTLILYLIFLPILMILFLIDLLPWTIAGWFFVLLLLEHVNQELGRLLNAMSKQIAASVSLFLRVGAWPIVVVMLMYVDPRSRSLEYVFLAWSCGSALALLCAWSCIAGVGASGWRMRIDWGWIRNGLKVAVPLLISTLAIRGILTVDRYWFESLAGVDVLATYVFFMGVSGVLVAALDAGVFPFLYPALIGAIKDQNADLFRENLSKLLSQTVILAVIAAFVGLILIDPVLQWLDRPLYSSHKDIFLCLLSANFIYALGMVPHYALYAQGLDRSIVNSHIASFVIFIPVTWLLSKYTVYLAVPLAVCASFMVSGLWKVTAFYRLTPVKYRLRINAVA